MVRDLFKINVQFTDFSLKSFSQDWVERFQHKKKMFLSNLLKNWNLHSFYRVFLPCCQKSKLRHESHNVCNILNQSLLWKYHDWKWNTHYGFTFKNIDAHFLDHPSNDSSLPPYHIHIVKNQAFFGVVMKTSSFKILSPFFFSIKTLAWRICHF